MLAPTPDSVNQLTQRMVPVLPPVSSGGSAVALSPGLEYLRQFPQFIVWKEVPNPIPGEKPLKHPVDWRSKAFPVSAIEAAHWTDFDSAASIAASWGHDYHVGFVLTPECGVFCFDNDSSNKGGQLNESICNVWAKIPGALELSHSRGGHHIYGRYTGVAPSHGKRGIIDGLKVELYTSKRFIALGDQSSVLGNMKMDCTAGLHQLIAESFPQTSADVDRSWTDAAEEGWDGPESNEDLRVLFLAGSKDKLPTNRQLWEADEAALTAWKPEADRADGIPYDPTKGRYGLGWQAQLLHRE